VSYAVVVQGLGKAGSTEPLGEAAPRFLETEATVEVVCGASTLRGGQEDETATARPRLLLHRADESLTDPAPATTLVDDDRAELGRRLVVLEREADVDACQPDDLSIQLGDDQTIRGAFRQSIRSLYESLDRGRIAELRKQLRQRSAVVRAGISYLQAHG
jgi:hypothetical protein